MKHQATRIPNDAGLGRRLLAALAGVGGGTVLLLGLRATVVPEMPLPILVIVLAVCAAIAGWRAVHPPAGKSSTERTAR